MSVGDPAYGLISTGVPTGTIFQGDNPTPILTEQPTCLRQVEGEMNIAKVDYGECKSQMNCHPDRSEAEWRDLLFTRPAPTQPEAPLLFIGREADHGPAAHKL